MAFSSIQLWMFIYVPILGAGQALEQHVIIYNPLAWNITSVVNMTVTFPSAVVHDDDGQPVPAQVHESLLLFEVI